MHPHHAKLIEAVLRTLKTIYAAPQAPSNDIFRVGAARSTFPHWLFQSDVLPGFISLLDAPYGAAFPPTTAISLASLAASLFARGTRTHEQQAVLHGAGVAGKLLRLLACDHAKVQESAVDALASLVKDNAAIAAEVAAAPVPPTMEPCGDHLRRWVRSRHPRMRLYVVNMYACDHHVG